MSDAEKIVIDLGSVKVDLSFERGESPTCGNFSQAGEESPKGESAAVRSSFSMGACNYSRSALEKLKLRNERVKINAVGLLNLASDITPALALEVVESINVIGIFQAQNDVKTALLNSGRIA